MQTTQQLRAQPAAEPYSWVNAVIGLLAVAAILSVAGGFYEASRPHHSAAWVGVGALGGLGWLVAATMVTLLRGIAENTRP